MVSVVIGNTGARGLRATRTRLGLTLDDVSALSGLSPAFLSRLERDQRRLTGESAGRLARALGVPVRSILEPPEDAA
jgi:transcriptional regulator with XRE-family HTH domain